MRFYTAAHVLFWIATFHVHSSSCVSWTNLSNEFLSLQAPKDRTNVRVRLIVDDVRATDTKNLELQWIYYIHMTWNDSRLAVQGAPGGAFIVSGDHVTKIWRPDIHVSNSLETRMLDGLRSNTAYNLFQNGTVHWMSNDAPVRPDHLTMGDSPDPADHTGCTTPQVLLSGVFLIQYTNGERRQRVSLGSLCVVSIITQSTGLMNVVPEVSGVRAIDVWESFCVTMIFLAMLEFATMHFMCRMKKKHDLYVRISNQYDLNDSDGKVKGRAERLRDEIGRYSRLLRYRVDPAKIDHWARVLFPVTFLLFNIIYWPVITSVE